MNTGNRIDLFCSLIQPKLQQGTRVASHIAEEENVRNQEHYDDVCHLYIIFRSDVSVANGGCTDE